MDISHSTRSERWIREMDFLEGVGEIADNGTKR